MYKLRGWETIPFWTRDTWSLVRSVQFQEGSRAKRPCRDLYAWFVSILGVTSRLWHQANCTEHPACPWCHYEWNVNLFQFVLPIPYHACLCLQISCMCEKMPASGAYLTSRSRGGTRSNRLAVVCVSLVLVGKWLPAQLRQSWQYMFKFQPVILLCSPFRSIRFLIFRAC